MHTSESNHQMTELGDHELAETEGAYFSVFLAFFEILQTLDAALGRPQDGGREATDP